MSDLRDNPMRLSQAARRLPPPAGLFNVPSDEWGLVLTSAFLHLMILASYYLLRPLREEIGSTHREAVSSLWTIVFFAMLGVVPAYAYVVTRWRRHLALTGIFVFFVVNLLAFDLLLHRLHGGALAYCEKTFYVWISVYGLFAISVFWSLMADTFRNEQGKRLFGIIAAGGSLGGIIGSGLAGELLNHLPRIDLALVAGGLLLPATACLWYISKYAVRSSGPHPPGASRGADTRENSSNLRGNVWTGLFTVFRSPYLLGIALLLFLHSMGSTFLYYEKLHLVDAAIIERARRAAFFARVDLYANIATIGVQALLLAHLLRRIGVGATLLAQPLVTLAGFLILGISLLASGGVSALGKSGINTVFITLVSFETVRRAVNFALAKPTREILFTVVDREAKYKAKAFIDTVVYRGSDVVHGWFFTGLTRLGLGLAGIALLATPFAAVAAFVALYLGRTQDRLLTARTPGTSTGESLRDRTRQV